MRQATHDVGFNTNEAGALLGICLGYDFCAEHEYGHLAFLKKKLGIEQKDFPLGVEDRTMTHTPEDLYFGEYAWKSKDKRFKKTLPAAVMHLCNRSQWDNDFEGGALHRIERLGMTFWPDPFKDVKWYKADRDDIRADWSADDGFAIHVRGQDNVDKLKAVHQAMLECKVSLADASMNGFLRRGPSLVLVDAVSPELAKQVKDADLAHLHLHEQAKATGVEAALKAAGKGWYALSPRLREGEGSELLFFLNPREQKKYASGWFQVSDLMDWAQDKGAIVDGQAVEAKLRAMDVDYSYHLVGGFKACGLAMNNSAEVWVDAAKTVPGLKLLMAKDSRDRVADGIYAIDQLEVYLDMGRKAHARDKAEYEAKKAAKVNAQYIIAA